MTTFKPFEPSDWWTFSGAENFGDGSVPLIAEVTWTKSQQVATIVLGGGGLGVLICPLDGDTEPAGSEDPWYDAEELSESNKIFLSQSSAKEWAESITWVPELLAFFRRG